MINMRMFLFDWLFMLVEHYLMMILFYMKFQTEAELLAEKRCVAHLIGEVHI